MVQTAGVEAAHIDKHLQVSNSEAIVGKVFATMGLQLALQPAKVNGHGAIDQCRASFLLRILGVTWQMPAESGEPVVPSTSSGLDQFSINARQLPIMHTLHMPNETI